MDILGFNIYDRDSDRWLQDDERTWGGFDGAAEITEEELARSIAERESTPERTLYVFACLSS